MTMTVTRFGSAQSFLFQRASTVSMLGIYSDQDSIPTPPFRLLPSTQRCAEPRLTASDRSGSAGSERSSVGLQRLVGWNPRSNLLRLPSGGIGLKLGAARRVEKRLRRDLRHDSLFFRHSLSERRVDWRTDDDGDSLRFCTVLPFPVRFYGLIGWESTPTRTRFLHNLSDYCPPPNVALSRA